jgi:hypothetical protein
LAALSDADRTGATLLLLRGNIPPGGVSAILRIEDFAFHPRKTVLRRRNSAEMLSDAWRSQDDGVLWGARRGTDFWTYLPRNNRSFPERPVNFYCMYIKDMLRICEFSVNLPTA